MLATHSGLTNIQSLYVPIGANFNYHNLNIKNKITGLKKRSVIEQVIPNILCSLTMFFDGLNVWEATVTIKVTMHQISLEERQ